MASRRLPTRPAAPRSPAPEGLGNAVDPPGDAPVQVDRAAAWLGDAYTPPLPARHRPAPGDVAPARGRTEGIAPVGADVTRNVSIGSHDAQPPEPATARVHNQEKPPVARRRNDHAAVVAEVQVLLFMPNAAPAAKALHLRDGLAQGTQPGWDRRARPAAPSRLAGPLRRVVVTAPGDGRWSWTTGTLTGTEKFQKVASRAAHAAAAAEAHLEIAERCPTGLTAVEVEALFGGSLAAGTVYAWASQKRISNRAQQGARPVYALEDVLALEAETRRTGRIAGTDGFYPGASGDPPDIAKRPRKRPQGSGEL